MSDIVDAHRDLIDQYRRALNEKDRQIASLQQKLEAHRRKEGTDMKTYIAKSDAEAKGLCEGTITLLVIPTEPQPVHDDKAWAWYTDDGPPYGPVPWGLNEPCPLASDPRCPFKPRHRIILKGQHGQLICKSVECKQVDDLTPEQMLAAGLDAFGWDYAEGSDPDDEDGTMFAYWDYTQSNPPEWAAWASSCECIEEIWRSYWKFLYPKLPRDSNPWCWIIEVTVGKEPT